MIYAIVWGAALASSVGIWVGLRFLHKPAAGPARAADTVVYAPRGQARSWKGQGGRLDRGPFYICMMWSLFAGGLIMVIGGPIHPSTIDAMSPGLQRVMALVLCLGTGTCIFGSASGSRHLRPHADLRDCYHLAVIATPANVSTLAVYAAAVGNTVHWNPQLFGLGAGGILAVMVAHLMMAWDLHFETKRLNERVRAALRAVADETKQ